MEINLENAFIVAIKLSIGPFVSSLDVATLKLEELIHRHAIKALEKPLLSTLLFSCVIILLTSAITVSVLVTTGFLCLTVVVLLVEGFVFGMIITLAAAITVSIFAFVIIMVGIVSSYKRKV